MNVKDRVTVSNPKLATFNKDGHIIGFSFGLRRLVQVKLFGGGTRVYKAENLTPTSKWRKGSSIYS